MSTSVPDLHVSSKSSAKGSAVIPISSRQDAVHAGRFTVKLDVTFDPGSDQYPAGTIDIKTDLSDSLKATFSAASIELINSFGKHNPTVFLTGRCKATLEEHAQLPEGCKYWIMIADNKLANASRTPDIVGFVVIDRTGTRIAYGTGPVETGDISVSTTG
jgi:hypothetical protein